MTELQWRRERARLMARIKRQRLYCMALLRRVAAMRRARSRRLAERLAGSMCLHDVEGC